MRLHLPVALRWGDLDAFNHVNNVSLLKILEEARVRALWSPTTAGEDAPSTAVIGAGTSGDDRGGATLTLIARQEIEYLAPIEYRRAPLDIQLWFGALGGASFDLCYDVVDGPGTIEGAESAGHTDADVNRRVPDGPNGAIGRQAGAVAAEPRSYARAMATVVLVDSLTMRPRRIDARERAAWEPYLGEPITFRRR
ncbi:acyl-CoA thioesterase [Mycetocola reblochoni]|uniref:Thioesterase domain-containing protein n=2 Tax=Mycetocola reblochoni TaxID=331618 RepID=A0A1R4JCP5_9MICO|nr:acyl-CoA thioesterase [Mycetocola reblochoni]RLP69950.1 acyl-CoA thioesterase [Mycetocola reblochoni]SJN29921.1 hypothetical protein FM119_06865 [Mycetocola reblochoni REB411]